MTGWWRGVPWARTDDEGRPPLLLQLLTVGLFLGLYDAIRRLAPGRVGVAQDNAHRLLDAESSLGLDWERSLNGWLAGHDVLGYLAGTVYDSLHYLVTFPLLIAVYVWAPRSYRGLRDVLLLVNALGLVVFWLAPMAPPRLLDSGGYTDVVAQTGALGGWASTLASTADQYAAMPSLHVGWAAWVSLALVTCWPGRRTRALAVAYPLVTTVVIVVTGNHWLLDAVAGAATLAVSVALVAATGRLRARPTVEGLTWHHGVPS